MATIITVQDVPESVRNQLDDATLTLLVDGLNARALRVAPCLGAEDVAPERLAEAKMILIGAIRRIAEAGSGALSQQTIGPASVSIDTRQRSGGYNLWPSEIEQLQELCSALGAGDAFMVDMVQPAPDDALSQRPDLQFQWG